MPDSNSGDDYKPFATTMIGSAQGAAALLLVESLIQRLIECSILSVHDAIDLVEGAADVELELDPAGVGPPFGDFQSLLTPIANSLRHDFDD